MTENHINIIHKLNNEIATNDNISNSNILNTSTNSNIEEENFPIVLAEIEKSLKVLKNFYKKINSKKNKVILYNIQFINENIPNCYKSIIAIKKAIHLQRLISYNNQRVIYKTNINLITTHK
jgi:hypothetical protein